MELTVGGRSLFEPKNQRGIFQADALSQLRFIIAMMLTYSENAQPDKNLVDRKKISIALSYMDDIKLFAKNEKELETLIHAVRIYSQDIGMKFSIENIPC